jgi:hypothetical protein
MEHTRNTSTKCVNLSEGGAAIGWIILCHPAIKNDSGGFVARDRAVLSKVVLVARRALPKLRLKFYNKILDNVVIL